MRINPSTRSLQLVLQTLDSSIAPELQSAVARGALELIRATLGDLLKRQGGAVDLLHQCIASGEQLEQELRAALGETAHHCEPASAQASFDGLADRHALLTERLDALCQSLRSSSLDQAISAALLRRAAEWELHYYRALPAVSPPTSVSPATAAPPLSREFLQSFLNRQRSEQQTLAVTHFAPLLGGFGKQTFLCTTRDAAGSSEELVIRKSDAMPIMLHGMFRLEQEFALLRCLSKTAFPVPTPRELAFELAGVDGTFYTMNRLPGRVAGSLLGGLQQAPPQALLLRLAELLAQLHQIPLSNFSDYFQHYEHASALQETTTARYRRKLGEWRQYVQSVEHLPSPFITWLFDWLERHIPADARTPVLTHGDFSAHNVLVDGDRVTGVLDWECADFGAPEQDLAYIQPQIAQHMDWQRFVTHYRACGGAAPDPARMQFCLAYGALRTSLGGNRGTHNLQRGANNDIRYVMVELGFAPMFMQLALSGTVGEATPQ